MIPEYRIEHIRRALGHLYEFEAFLGKGAFATVLLVRNRKLERLEALKILGESYDGNHEFAKRFVTEAKLIASLDHPNIVKVYDYGEVGGVLWYSMQYIDGPSLRAELETLGSVGHAEAAAVAVPLLDALAYSHEQGVIHRDVKPANILIDRRGQPFLMDFGIAKLEGRGFETQTGSVMGTPAYVAPEQAMGHSVDGRCDVYSLGITLYEMVCGAPPFRGDDVIQTLVKRLHNDVEPPSSQGVGLPEAFERILMKSLARNPDARFPSAGAMRGELVGQFGAELTVGAASMGSAARAPKPAKLGRGEYDPEADSDDLTVPTASPIPRPADPSEAVTRVGRALQAAEAPRRRSLVGPAIGVILVLALLAFVLGPMSKQEEPSTMPPASASSDRPAGSSTAGSDAAESDAAGSDIGAEPAMSAASEAAEDGGDGSEPTSNGDPIPQAASEAPSSGPSAGGPEPESTPPSADRSRSAADPGTPETRGPVNPPPPPPPPVRRPVEPPRILEAAQPAGPALESCAGEQVIVRAEIGEQGEVLASRSLAPTRDACERAALETLERYRFEPAVDYQGEPVRAPITLSIRFPRSPSE